MTTKIQPRVIAGRLMFEVAGVAFATFAQAAGAWSAAQAHRLDVLVDTAHSAAQDGAQVEIIEGEYGMTVGNAVQLVERVERWYDRHTRSYVVQRKDADGNQIGAADYCGFREWADEVMAEYAAEYGLTITARGALAVRA